MRRLLIISSGVVVGAIVAGSISGGSSQDDSTRTRGDATRFSSIEIKVTAPTGEKEGVCTLLADDDLHRARGLMDGTELDEHAGMVFRWPNDVDHSFHMKNVSRPLSLAWFDRDGRFLGSIDMDPCHIEKCPRYEPPVPYRFALEVPKGDLDRLNLGPDSRIQLGGACTPGSQAMP